MIFDRTLLFSNAQAIVADAASTDIVNLGATGTAYGHAAALVRDIGKGQCIPLLIQVVEAFNTLTSLRVVVQCDDNEAFSSAKDVLEVTLPLASLTVGRQFPLVCVPPGVNERYMRIYYDVIGTAPTLGKVTAGVVMGVQTNGVTF
ncbi:MAG TPA: hypothetical protein VIU82_21895 [Bosea sp. (in: a-proteobacteria)]